MILITGATGPTGADIARLLAPRGDVRVLLRDPAKSAGFDGCEVAIGDLSKPHTLSSALEGVDKVLLISPLAESMAELQGKLITAAKQAGVKHLVRISSAAADVASPRRIGRWHGECDRLAETSGIPFTHVRACNFMQNLLSFANEIASTGGFSAPMADGKIRLVERRDVAAVAAAVLTGAGHEGRAYVVTGDDLLGYDEVAAIIGRVIGREVQFRDITPVQAHAGFLDAGMPPWRADEMLLLYDYLRRSGNCFLTGSVQKITGRAPRRFEDYVREQAALFRDGGAVRTHA